MVVKAGLAAQQPSFSGPFFFEFFFVLHNRGLKCLGIYPEFFGRINQLLMINGIILFQFQGTPDNSIDVILLDGGVYTTLFWVVQIGLGSLLPLALLYLPATGNSRGWIGIASLLVIIGGLAQMYITIIGGQAYPMELFPGKEVTSSFFDGVVASYSPSLPEIILGVGGIGLALAATVVGIRVLRFLPTSLADEVVDPHAAGKAA